LIELSQSVTDSKPTYKRVSWDDVGDRKEKIIKLPVMSWSDVETTLHPTVLRLTRNNMKGTVKLGFEIKLQRCTS
jgi:hypothetical protein